MTKRELIINSYEILRPLSQEFKRRIQNVYIYGNSGTNVLLSTKDDTVFEYNCTKNKLTRIVELDGIKVVKFDSGFDFSAHILALTNNGKVYGWGNNYWGQLGNGTCDNSYTPNINLFLNQFFVTDICCGGCHSLILTNDGEIFAFGGNNWGQIGSNCYDNQLTPLKLNALNSIKIVAITCGFYHSLALSECGRVFIWGYNEYESNRDTQNTPTLIQMPYTDVIIDKIISGSYHSLLLSIDGDIYAFGSNECGQLGIKSKRSEKCTPTKINTSSKFVDIASSKYSNISVGLSSSGTCSVWGKCGEELFKHPKQTDLIQICEAFAKYSKPQITFSTLQIPTEIFLIEKNEKFALEFTTIKLLGSGGFGEVIQAKSVTDSKMYAIKQLAIKMDDKQNVSKELTFLSQFKSHFIVEYFDSWLESNQNNVDQPITLYIQMELCSITLKHVNHLLKQSLIASEMLTLIGYYIACDLFTEIFECVNYLHIQCPSIIHRDLKPDNILITEGINGRFVKLADFGLSTFHEFSEQSHTCGTGTKQYVAPEVYYTKCYDTKVDIYSLGAIMLETYNIDFNACQDELDGKDENIFYLNFLKKLIPKNGAKHSSKTGRKYKVICKLIKKMLSANKKNRPSCSEILSNKQSWIIDINDINDDKELAKYRFANLNTKSFVENFHYFFINRKLKYYNIF